MLIKFPATLRVDEKRFGPIMIRGMRTAIATAAVLLYLFVVADRWSEGLAQSAAPAPGPQPRLAAAVSPQVPPSQVEGKALINQYCMTCHSDRISPVA